MKPIGLSVGIAVLSIAVAATGACAETIQEFYGKTQLRYVVGNTAGGGYDTYVRTTARHIGKYIPGNPSFIVENLPGAGGIRAASYIYNVAPKDGSVLGSVTTASATEPLFGNKQAQYDPAKFTWIGNIDSTISVCLTRAGSGVESFKDVLSRETIFGATGAGGATSQHVSGLNRLLGAKIKLIAGYKGMSDLHLALQRKEIQGICGSAYSLIKAQYPEEVKSGTLRPLVQMTDQRHSDISDVPAIREFAKTAEEREIMDLVFGRHVIGRPILGPPDIPADRSEALRDAFMRTMRDAEFLAEAEKQKMDLSPMSGAEVEALIKRYAAYPASTIERAKDVMKEN